MRLIRDAVNKEIEVQRNAGKIGSALEADVRLYCEPELKAELDKLENELRFVLITSSAEVQLADATRSELAPTDVPGLWLKVNALAYPKCERCWHRREEIGQNATHPTLCGRCVENVDGQGEVRHYA